ncbi:MAG: endonuclease/exonuclease/phosphatase family protein [bacterium]
MINFLLALFAVIIIAATLLPVLRKQDWWIRIFDFPRLHLAVLSALAAAGLLWAWDGPPLVGNILLLLLLGCLAYHLLKILPYTPLFPTEVPAAADGTAAQEIRLLVSNVLMSNRCAEKLLAIVDEAGPDMILILEADSWWAEHLSPLEKRFAHTMTRPLDNTYGMLLYSRWALENPRIRHLVNEGVPSFHAQVRTDSEFRFDFRGVHPKPPRPNQDAQQRDAELIQVGQEVQKQKLPAIVAGDLNDVAWSHTTRLFQKASGLLDPRIGRGLYNTFHAQHPLLRWPLDHVFHSPHFSLKEIRLLPSFGSDHFPFFIVLQYDPDRMPAPPEPDGGERREIHEKQETDQGRTK